LFLTFPTYAQLQDFQLDVTVTNETCAGNGTFTFTTANTTPGASISYTVYMLPDVTNPISISSSNFLGSLAEGTYKIVATQSLGQQTNTQEAEAIIVKITAPLDFDISATNQTCVEGANLIVNVTEGTGALYEIISGPVILPAQESNVFTGLPAGVYVIRVFDECGDAEVTTYTLAASPAPPAITPPAYENTVEADCDTITVTNTISYGEGIAITYPITIEYTLTPNNGNPSTTIVQTFESGDAIALSLTQTFPVDDADYSYTIKITDSCNNQYVSGEMTLNPERAISHIANIILPCGEHYLSINVANFSPPFTLEFTQSPEGFDPVALNAAHPGPFASDSVQYGDLETAVPPGDYTVVVLDKCGNTMSYDFSIEDEIVEPAAGGSNNGCFSEFGRITISVPMRKIVSAIIIEAPDAYTATNTLPKDVSANINSNGVVILTNMPKGEYKFIIIDECGKQYETTVVIPDFEVKGFTGSAMTGCVAGSGAARVSSLNGKLVTLTITNAPVEFNEILPFDVSSYIDDAGIFFMEGLPPGVYHFSGVDICGVVGDAVVTVNSSSPPANAVEFIRKCGNFDLKLSDSGADTFADPPTYWLQKLVDANNNVWGHPVTGVVFPENTEPTAENSILLINGQTLTALEYEGTFRVIKHFESYISPENIQACFGALGTFEYSDGVVVKSVYNLSCFQNANDIYVDATGLAPLHYTIIAKDDVPFALDNGNNSIFSNLDPAKYEFLVEDACGFVGTIEVDIRQLPELTNAHDPGDMLVCIEPDESQSSEFDLLTQTPLILDTQPAALYTITYHLSAEDAEVGINAIPTLHTNTSNPETIYARLIHNHIPLCHDVVSFDLRVSEYPELKMQRDYILCNDDNNVKLYADAGFNSYEWSTGETTPTITVKQSGTYWVKVGNEYDGIICETIADILVILSGPPETWSIGVEDWTDNNNSIFINTTGAGNYEYSIDGAVYQDDPFFGSLETGVYTVYIRDKNGCGIVSEKVALLNYPKFFTPNGDGINEKWSLQYSWFEPEALIYIYDRYGKLIYFFTPLDSGWDGTFNGRSLPSTDYWFVVVRKSGKIHKGHFSMIR
jgi:gliding motility-associated-like protein